MNPLEDIYVALRPTRPAVPFVVPDSIRPLDPSMPLGSTIGFTNINPLNGNPVTPTPVVNVMYNFGWEFMWHCHLLGQEDNDMMRTITVRSAPPIWADLLMQDPS